MVLDNTYVASQASAFIIKERFYNLNLKQFKWNVQVMTQNVCEKLVNLVAAGHASNPTNVIITLFRAYATSTNNKFKSLVSNWKNEWNSGAIKEPKDLMRCTNAKYFELRNLGT